MSATLSHLPDVTFTPGGFLTRQGESGDTAWLILAGEVEVFAASGTETRRVGRLAQRQVVGEMALIDPGPRSATVVARTEVVATQIPREI